MVREELPLPWNKSLLAICPGLLATAGLGQHRFLSADVGRPDIIGRISGFCILVEQQTVAWLEPDGDGNANISRPDDSIWCDRWTGSDHGRQVSEHICAFYSLGHTDYFIGILHADPTCFAVCLGSHCLDNIVSTCRACQVFCPTRCILVGGWSVAEYIVICRCYRIVAACGVWAIPG